ncbi:MAG: biotin--[acetyl-CoA-carboxylase] ligase [Atribacterota bacterium]|nr:biotin--[acetyl-CoA-carboxylase] ligase [Atribacterota bacterium]MDD5636784.1 biotin--[acetyl-CoA-carboxylase] ligase [Atribacterota bacterium]
MNLKNLDIPVLSYLSEEYPIAIEELSNRLSLSRAEVEKQIQQLKQLGYSISINDQKSYRIISRPDILLPFEIKNKLTTRYIGQTIYYFPALTSTNIIAKQKILRKTDNIPEGTIIITEQQSEGKGRLGKTWFSPAGGIWLSIILYPEIISSSIGLITLMAAVVVANTISKLFPIKAQIKWPNDILIDDRKVCGILTEMSTETKNIQWVIVGIGINANNDSSELPEDIRKCSISLKEITGQLIPRVMLVQYLCTEWEKFYEMLKRKDFSLILEEWKLYNNIIGKRIRLDTEEKIIAGEAINISDKGALIFKTDDGKTMEIISGTVLK